MFYSNTNIYSYIRKMFSIISWILVIFNDPNRISETRREKTYASTSMKIAFNIFDSLLYHTKYDSFSHI